MIGVSDAANVISRFLPEPHASMLNGIVWGIPLTSHPHLVNELKQAGIIHIAVLSGANITLLVEIVHLFTARISRNISILISAVLIIIFTFFVGLQAPIMRASISSILTYVAIINGRRSSALYILFLSAFISCLLFPAWITSISFQLSYAACLGLIFFTYKSPFKNSLATYCYEEFFCSLSAQVFTIPVIYFYFHQISIVAPLTNLLISWTIGPLMFVGFIITFLGAISPLLVFPFTITAYMLLSWILFVVHLVTQIPFSYIQL